MIGETRLAQAKRGVEKPGVVDSMNSPRNHRSAMKPFDRKNKQPSTTLFHLSNWLNGKTTGDQYLQQLEAFVKENPRDLEAWASLINFRLYQHGPSITAVEMGMQQPATTDSVLTQMGTRFARSIADVLGAQYTSALNDLPEIDQEYGPTANRYQTERRNLLLRSRTSMSEQIWTCAVDMVKNNPTRAIDVLRQEHELGHPTLKRAVTMLFPPPQKSTEQFYSQLIRGSLQMVQQLETCGKDPDQLSEDELMIMAINSRGGVPLITTIAIAFSIVRVSGALSNFAFNQIPGAKPKITGEYLPIISKEAAALEFWGDWGETLQLLSETPVKRWPAITEGWAIANALAYETASRAREAQT